MKHVSIDAETLLAHGDFMRALAKSLLFDDTRVDDVVQEAWLAALRSPPRDPTRLRAWLGRVVRNFALRAHRDRRRRAAHEGAAPPPRIPSAQEILGREKARHAVVLAVLALPEPYRSAVVLRYLEELPPREVARRLAVPVETVRTRLKRALARLRTALDDEHGDRRAWSLALIPFAVPQASAAAGAVTGAILMGSKTKLAAVAAILLLTLTMVWWAPRADEPGARVPASRREAFVPPSLDPDSSPATTMEVERPRAAPSLPEGTTIAGVVTADGTPLEGAYVYLKGESLAARRTTDANGRFAFDQEGSYVLGAAHAERAPRKMKVTARRGELTEVILELPAAPHLDVRVVDAKTGAPLPGAEDFVLRSGEQGANVVLQSMLAAEGGLPGLLRRYAVFDNLLQLFRLFDGDTPLHIPPRVTGADGRTRIGGLLTTAVELVVTHEAYPGQLVRHAAESGDEVLIELLPGASLTVVAPRFDGQLAAGYVCEVDRASLFPVPFASARFDEEGRASFAPLRPGAYVVSVSKDGAWQITLTTEEKTDAEGRPAVSRHSSINHESDAVLLKKAIVLREGVHEVLDLSGIGGARIAGRLFLEGDPRPWRIRLLLGDEEVASASADAEGRFSFDKVAPGKYRVTAYGYGKGEAAADCHVAAGDEVSVRLQVPQGEISGLVTGPDGRPLAGVTIYGIATAGLDRLHRELRHVADLALFGATVESGKDGTFHFPGIPAGGYTLFCARDGFLSRRELHLAQGQHRRIDIHLDATHLHRVALRLTGERGDPVRGHLLVRGDKGGLLTAMALALEDVATDRFTLHLEEGRYLLDIFAEGRAPLRGRAVEVRGPMELAVRLERGVAVTLVVESAKGPVPGAVLEIRDPAGLRLPRDVMLGHILFEPRPWRTDARGRVVLPHVLPGRYTVHRDGKEIGDFRVGRTAIQARIRLK